MKRIVVHLDSETEDELPFRKIRKVDKKPPRSAQRTRDTGVAHQEEPAPIEVLPNAVDGTNARALTPPAAAPAASVELQYPRATIRRTFNRFYPNDPQALSMAQILGDKTRIKSMVAAAYCNDIPWLVKEAYAGIAQVALICHKGVTQKAGVFPVRSGDESFLRIFPPTSSLMHIKFKLCFFDTFTRVVILSANNVSYDHDTMENIIWLQDFPLHSKGDKTVTFQTTDFGQIWERTLKACRVPERLWRPQMEATNFGDIDQQCRLVLSWPGKYAMQSTRSGHRMLAEQVRNLGLTPPPGHSLTVEYNTSSVGIYTHDWLEQFYTSLIGSEPTTRKRFDRAQDVPIRFIYPSHRHVKESILGAPGGGSLFFPRNGWEEKGKGKSLNPFASQNVRDGISKRFGVLQHTKTMLVFFKPNEDVTPLQGRRIRGWAYVGSANFTPSALGRTNHDELAVANCELGVIFPLVADDDAELECIADDIATWKRPVLQYQRDKPSKPGQQDQPGRPWIQALYNEDKANKPYSMYHDLQAKESAS